jgi:biotin synthase
MSIAAPPRTDWNDLADLALAGEPLTRDQALSVVESDDAELPALIAAAWRVRRHHWGNTVQLYYLRNAKSGLCPEDCKYCSQSVVSEAEIPKYVFQNEEKLLEGARAAKANNARTYCIVASGRGPSNREVEHVAKTVERIKAETGLHICCCLGLLKPEQAARLKAAGVDRVNHNLNTSRRFHESIVTTHTYEDRLATLRTCRDAGLELCAGMIVGMGETPADLVDVAFELRSLECESIPVNFLHPIEGTPLGPSSVASRESTENGDCSTLNPHPSALTPRDCLRALCLMRLVNPSSEIRIAGGREVNLRSLQPLGLYPANSVFVSDYLTTPGQSPSEDFKMIEDLGFEVVLR